MSLVLCRFTVELVIDVEKGASREKIRETAQRFVAEEIDRAEFDGYREVTSLISLPPAWRDSLPYRDSNEGPELTCRQILELGKP